MAIDRSEFIKKVDIGLKANNSFTRFYLRFKTDTGKQHHKIFDYSDKTWDKRTRVTKAKSDAMIYRADTIEKMSRTYFGFDEDSTLDKVADEYFSKECSPNSKWTQEKKDAYRLYLKNSLGSLKIKDIKLNHINTLRTNMEKRGCSKQTKNGCSPRTIKKVLIQVLRPIMHYAHDNEVLNRVPKIELSKAHQKQNQAKKKVVENATVKFKTLHEVIMQLYKDDPFYRALFLFAMHGRRWGEIKTLEWRDVDFENQTYTIRAENNKINKNQTYVPTPEMLDAIAQIPSNKDGLIFSSPVTGKVLYRPKRQLQKIINISKINNLTMHYFRHIFVSAMGESGVPGTILSASLGHASLDTVNTFYLSANHTNSSKVANGVIDKILQNNLQHP